MGYFMHTVDGKYIALTLSLFGNNRVNNVDLLFMVQKLNYCIPSNSG